MRSWWWKLVQNKKSSQFKVALFFLILYFILSGTFIYIRSSNELPRNKNLEVCLHGLLYDARLDKKNKLNYLDSVEIEISDVNSLNQIGKSYTNKAGAFFAKIPLQNKLQIKLFKQGWFSRKIIIDTNVPMDNLRQFHLFIDAELFRKMNGIKLEEKDFPVLEIYYDKEEKRFVTFLNKVTSFNKKIKKLYINKSSSIE